MITADTTRVILVLFVGSHVLQRCWYILSDVAFQGNAKRADVSKHVTQLAREGIPV